MSTTLNKKVAAYFVSWVAAQRAIAPQRTSEILRSIWGETSAPVIVRGRRVFSFDLVQKTLDAFASVSTLGEWIDEALGHRISLPLYLHQIARADPAGKALRYPRRMLQGDPGSVPEAHQHFPLEEAPEHLAPRLVVDLSWHVLRNSSEPNQILTAYGHLFTNAKRRGNAAIAASLALHALPHLREADSWHRGRFYQRAHLLPVFRLEASVGLEFLLRAQREFDRCDPARLATTYVDLADLSFLHGDNTQAEEAAHLADALLPQSLLQYRLKVAYLLTRVALQNGSFDVATRHFQEHATLAQKMPPAIQSAARASHVILASQFALHDGDFETVLDHCGALLEQDLPNISFRVAVLLDKAIAAAELQNDTSFKSAISQLRTLALAKPVAMPRYFWSVIEDAASLGYSRRATSFSELATRLLQPGRFFQAHS